MAVKVLSFAIRNVASCACGRVNLSRTRGEGGFTRGTQWLVWKFESDSTLGDALQVEQRSMCLRDECLPAHPSSAHAPTSTACKCCLPAHPSSAHALG